MCPYKTLSDRLLIIPPNIKQNAIIVILPRRSFSAENCEEKALNSSESSAEKLRRNKSKKISLLNFFLKLSIAINKKIAKNTKTKLASG